jgi:uncharacterized surface protein with fasciclin (FAS1) repeats
MFRRSVLAFGLVQTVDLRLPLFRRRQKRSLYEVVAQTPDFSLWKRVVDEAGLAALLAGQHPLTIFVPTDDAFAGLPADVRAVRRESQDQRRRRLEAIVRDHMLAGVHRPAEIAAGRDDYPTLGAGTMSFSSVGTRSLTVEWTSAIGSEGAAITDLPIEAANGLLYVISKVFIA